MTTRVLTRFAVTRSWRGALAVAASNVLVTVTAVLGYTAAYPDPADRVTLAESIGSNPGLVALFGEPVALETQAGFTEWRVSLVLALVAAVWALFAATRLMRGEEESGRADVVLAGPVTRTSAAAATVRGLALSLALLVVVTVVGFVAGTASDLGAARAAGLGLAVCSLAAVMAGVGALTSQLADTRRRALAIGAAVLGAFYVVRVVADSRPSLNGLRWATPLGWLELSRPLTEPDPWPVLLGYVLAVVLAVVALGLVSRRDVGAGLLVSQDSARARVAVLRGPAGLAVRLARGSALGWALGLGSFGLLIGLVARTAAEAMADAADQDALSGFGITETGTTAYVGVSFVLVTLALAVAAAGQVSAARDEEESGRLDTLLAAPVSRWSWLGGRVVVATGVLAAAAAAAVGGAWLAGRVSDLGVSAVDLATAGVNALPAALFVLGLGMLLLGVVPRLAGPLTYSVVAGSFLLEIVGSAVELPEWLLSLSVLHHVQPAPAVDPDWTAAAVLVGLGVALALAGGAALRVRDLQTG
jgi:ABC-2 type transport system permease protein